MQMKVNNTKGPFGWRGGKVEGYKMWENGKVGG